MNALDKQKAIRKLLKQRPHTTVEICAALGIYPQLARYHLNVLQAKRLGMENPRRNVHTMLWSLD